MTSTIKVLGIETVDPTTLTPHPQNANHGDVNAIAESLTTHGQYRPVVVNQHSIILAGHHVVEGAKQLGWNEVRIERIEADEATSLKILLADNRIAELGDGLDPDALLAILEQLDGDLTGTGYDDDYLTMLEEIAAGAPSLDDLEEEAGPAGHDDHNTIVRLNLDPDLAKWWAEYRLPFTSDTNAVVALRQAAGQ